MSRHVVGVGHDMDGFLRWVERDLVRVAPLVQLGFTPLGLCRDGVDAGIVFELPEPVQIVSTDDFHESCLGILERRGSRVWDQERCPGKFERTVAATRS